MPIEPEKKPTLKPREIVIQKIANGYIVRSPAPYAYKSVAEVIEAVRQILQS